MKIILLSGGSGKRLWPLSNNTRSKQFLRVLNDKDQGLESMIQRVWRQIKLVEMVDSTFIATSKDQVDIINNQLDCSTPLIIEPSRRDTFPAVSLACTYLSSIKKVDMREVICVVPADPFVELEFFEKIKEMEDIVDRSEAELTLIGVKPKYPAENYGYIVPKSNLMQDKNQNQCIEVKCFIEKPEKERAKQLIKEHALWNCGVFAFKLGYLISLLKERQYPTSFKELVQNYDRLPNRSFDYEVVEKAKKTIAVPYFGCWKDLGTWNTLTEEMDTNILGKGIISDDSTDSYLINELNIPVVVQGLSNVVVASSPDGVLVTDKFASNRIKESIKTIEQRPMYEEKRWGWYRVLDYIRHAENKETLTKRIKVFKGKSLSYQMHAKRSEVWAIISGEGDFALNGVIHHVKQGDVLHIPTGAKHGIKACTDLEFIEIQTGSELVEGDIVRIFMTWEEVERHCKEQRL